MAIGVYDNGDGIGRNAIVSYAQIIGLAPAAIQYDQNALRALTVEGSSGNGTFTVASTPSNPTVPVPTAIGDAGTDQVLVEYVSGTNGAGLTLTNYYPAASSYTIGGPVGSIAGFGPVSIQNYGLPVTLTVDDSANTTARNVAIANTAITGLPLATISYTEVAQVNVLLGSGANQVDVSNFTGNGSLSGGGSATLIAIGSASFTLSDTLFTRSGGGTARLALAGFSNAMLTATAPGTHFINAMAFSGTATIVNPTDPPAGIGLLAIAQTMAIVTNSYGTVATHITDAQGNPLGGVPVTFAVVPGSGGAGGNFAGNATVSTNADGVAVSPALISNTMAGSFAVTATAGSLTTTATLTNLPGAAAVCNTAGGNAQNAIVGTAFATSLQALVTDAFGNPVAGVPVTFSVPASGATGAFSMLPTVLTDAQGLATAPHLIANHIRGAFTVTATALGISKPANLQLTNTARPATMTPVTGNNQRGTVGNAFTTALTVKVVDGFGLPVRGITVEFVAPSSNPVGAALNGPASVLTDANGVATAPKLIANGAVGAFSVEAWVGGLKTPTLFTLYSVASTPAAISVHTGSNQNAAPNTAFVSALSALVTDAFGNPVKGAVVTFAVTPTGDHYRAAFGSKAAVTAITDAHGVATAPVLTALNVVTGTFTVTATVTGASTPAVFNLSNIRPVGHK
jgi:hypothetical protein